MAIIVNGGAVQRSRVVEIRVPASEYPQGATVINITTMEIETEVDSRVEGSTLILTAQVSSLPDARYAVVPSQGHFHCLFGDVNGDGFVDSNDEGLFGSAFGTVVGQLGYNAAFDKAGDGVIGPDDEAAFLANLGHSI